MTCVIKVKYGETLRRFMFRSTKPGGEDLSYLVLENKIRSLLDIAAEKQIRVTYNDEDNDMITMANDQDLIDAVITQSLNPLRLHVTPIRPKRSSRTSDQICAGLTALEQTSDVLATPKAHYRQSEGGVKTNAQILRRPATSTRQLYESVEKFLSQVPAAVKSPEVKSRKLEDANLDWTSTPLLSQVPAAVKCPEVEDAELDELWKLLLP